MLVLRCSDLEISKAFYEKLGFCFEQEQHGNGPVHYASDENGFVFELYPAKEGETDRTRVGFEISGLGEKLAHFESYDTYEYHGMQIPIITDPDGRKIELYDRQ